MKEMCILMRSKVFLSLSFIVTEVVDKTGKSTRTFIVHSHILYVNILILSLPFCLLTHNNTRFVPDINDACYNIMFPFCKEFIATRVIS